MELHGSQMRGCQLLPAERLKGDAIQCFYFFFSFFLFLFLSFFFLLSGPVLDSGASDSLNAAKDSLILNPCESIF